jgi:hypothetical protein
MWHLAIDCVCPGGALSVVLAAQDGDGTHVVLKLLAPWAGEAIAFEALALSAWKGVGLSSC